MAQNPMNRSVHSGDVEELLELARRQAETEFPNPDRVDCPDPAVLRTMASGGRSPSESVGHVLRCSPCYGQYIEFQRLARARRRIRFGLAGLATAAAVLVGLYFGRAGSTPQIAPGSQPRIEVARVAPQEKIPVTVNLAQFAVSRGDDSRRVRLPARLPAKRLLVTFQMPFGVEAGIYRVRLTQQSGPVMEEKTVRARFRDGVAFFELEFEAEGLAGKRVTLSVQPNGLSRREYPLLVDGLPPPKGGSASVEKKE